MLHSRAIRAYTPFYLHARENKATGSEVFLVYLHKRGSKFEKEAVRLLIYIHLSSLSQLCVMAFLRQRKRVQITVPSETERILFINKHSLFKNKPSASL